MRASRLSIQGPSNPEEQNWANASEEDIADAGEQFNIVVVNSGGDIELDIATWYESSLPTKGLNEVEQENQKKFLIEIAKRTTYAMAGFAILAIVLQAALTFFVYAKKPWRELFGRTLIALLGLGPLVEGTSVWTGKEDPDLVLTGPQVYAAIKGTEIAFESIPESIIQINGVLKQDYGDIKAIQVIGVISSIVPGAFIMMDGNFGFNLSKYLNTPGDPFYG
ncbi:hypothetical protein TrLO_g9678 [Triparma laevis f. longispina]|uniref:Uncharacterized protein n=1 Tax=Triparma laevis f. longispina TaxID=1714387 RepID=A0A9W7CEQ6_9STRA|nr:hypothetical protein TrLO_g9678 [Triparma laevis f. longispina]